VFGWIHEWMDGRLDDWLDGQKNSGCLDRLMDGWMD
jgi:hypothetical protein